MNRHYPCCRYPLRIAVAAGKTVTWKQRLPLSSFPHLDEISRM
jgi:hypothetical protein